MPQLGGKSFVDRSTSGTPILQRSDTGTVNWTSGWVSTDGTTTVADGAKLTFNHNLGTTDITVDVFVCDNASGTGEVNKIEEVFFQNVVGSFVSHGCQVQDITSEQLTISLSYYGYAHWSDSGTASTTDSSTTRGFGTSNAPDYKQKYIKVVATAGSGGSAVSKYNTGWVSQDDQGTPVSLANGAELVFTHNLGSTEVSVQMYASDASQTIIYDPKVMISGSYHYGAQVTGLTTNTVSVGLAKNGAAYIIASNMTTAITWGTGNAARIKLIITK